MTRRGADSTSPAAKAPQETAPTVLACAAREKARGLLRRAFTRRRSRLLLVRTVDAMERTLRSTLVDAVVVDAGSAGEAAWKALSLARELPSIPFFAMAAPRPADAPVLGRCATLEVADLLIEGVDDDALRELVAPLAFTARFANALAGVHGMLHLTAPLQQRAWEFVVSAGGRPVRTDAVAAALGVTREHLSRAFAADGAPNLKRVIDLVRLIAAAELAKNPFYDLADVTTVLGFASPTHLAHTAARVAGIRTPSLARLRPRDLILRFVQGRGRSRT